MDIGSFLKNYRSRQYRSGGARFRMKKSCNSRTFLWPTGSEGKIVWEVNVFGAVIDYRIL